LESGDLLRFDSGIVLNGYLSDFGRAAVVGEPDDGQLRLLDVLHGGLEAAISAVRPGARVADVVAAGEAALADAGVISQDDGSGRILSSFPVHWGHGLGLGWERPYLTAGEEMRIETGMYLAIERALTLPGVGTAAAEQTLLVASHGADVLTAGPSGFWS
jgi:Xaa-Pro dipeptidase